MKKATPRVTSENQNAFISTSLSDSDMSAFGEVYQASSVPSEEERQLQAERLAAISQTVSGLAHESRNALQRIQSTVNRLRRRIDTSNGLTVMLDEIEEAGDEVRLVFEKVRTFAAPIVLSKKDSALHEVWRRAWLDIPAERRRDARLIEAQNCVPKHCVVDEARLYQVFRSLFENALDASEYSLEIEVNCRDEVVGGNEGVCISVHDNGPGFNEEQVENVFEPFYTTKRVGTGLGLPLARRIVEAHGGTMQVACRTCGAEFIICLPNALEVSEGNGKAARTNGNAGRSD